MKRRLVFASAALLLVAALPAAAEPDGLTVEQAWARASVPGQKTGGAYLKLHNGGAADRLIGARSAAAERVELHSMKMDGDVMRMRRVPSLEVPSGRSVALEPGGYHFMLIGLKQPLVEGARIPLTLEFEKAGRKQVEAEVRRTAPDGADPHGSHEHHHDHHHEHHKH